MTFSYCNNKGAVAFAKGYRADAARLASSVQIPVEFILGVAASETEWGASRFAMEYNNFFSMETANPDTRIPYAIGYVLAAGTIGKKHPTRVAVYPSFYDSGLSFIDRWGKDIFGISAPQPFALALEGNKFNTGDPRTGGARDFAKNLIDTIAAVRARLACPA
jgi:hypothetical protein